MIKFLKWFGSILIVLVVVYLLGPRPSSPKLDTILPQKSDNLSQLENEINQHEKNTKTIKEDNEARIIWWNDSLKSKTPYSVVYLHGFSASQAEGAPLHEEFAQRYACNLYLARLDQHGLDDPDAFAQLSPESLLASAKEAISVGKAIGEEVIVIATSTGATLSLYIASGNPDIKALIIYSPLIDFYDPALWLLNKPWGLQLAKFTFGGDYFVREGIASEKSKQYWTQKYRLEGTVALKSLVDATMTPETFQKVKQPIFLGYYYKDEEHQDMTVSVEAMLKMYEKLGTPQDLKRKMPFPEAGNHVIASYITSRDLDAVRMETFKFGDEVLQLKPF